MLAVLSRYPLRSGNVKKVRHPGHKWPRTSLLQCIVRTPRGDIAFNNVHLPSPRYGLENILDRYTFINISRTSLLLEETVLRLHTTQIIQQMVASSGIPSIIAGDFNMPADSTIYRQFWGKYNNAFNKAGLGYGWTVWNTVVGFPLGLRVDHVLFDDSFVAIHCETGPDVGSDHLPLLGEIRRLEALNE